MNPGVAVKQVELDACGMQCPLPLLKAKQALSKLESGDQLTVYATDQGSVRDFRVYAEHAGHTLLESTSDDGVYTHVLQKA